LFFFLFFLASRKADLLVEKLLSRNPDPARAFSAL